MKKRSPIEETELVGVLHYVQGEADGLCVYYAVSMMLAALHPEWRLKMHEVPRGRGELRAKIATALANPSIHQ